jgi:TusA-related sulfurtransferase
MVTAVPVGAATVEGGDLPVGGGLLALVRPALDLLPSGAVLAVLSSAASARKDLPAWCRLEHHAYLGSETQPDGRDRHLIVRGHLAVPLGRRELPRRLARREGRLLSADLLAAIPMPERADTSSGFAPRGARLEPGGPSFPFSLLQRDQVAPPAAGHLYDQALAAQWDPGRDVPWDKVGRLPAAVETAVGQVMTFLAESALAALYAPARLLPRIAPAYAEVVMLLATQMADAGRHVDAFLKRARAGGGGVGVSTLATARSLLSLMQVDDFTEMAFLLWVLGEGSLAELLRFVEDNAPDEATAEIARRTCADAERHVQFGVAHVALVVSRDASVVKHLEAAVRRRADGLEGVSGLPAPVEDALTILAARGTEPRAVAQGHAAFRGLLQAMHRRRVALLQQIGLAPALAEALSRLHSRSLM